MNLLLKHVAAGYVSAVNWRELSVYDEALKDWRPHPDWAARWPNFSPEELACAGSDELRISVSALDLLQALRVKIGRPLILNSAYRSPAYNKRVGGASGSLHLQGKAFDVSMNNHDPTVFEAQAREGGFTGFGFYPPGDGNFIHIDTGRSRFWGTRWRAPKYGALRANGRPLGSEDV